MRAKVDDKKKHKARGVSLPPEMWKASFKRAQALDVSFSKYVQKLIRTDLERGVLNNQSI